MDRLISEKAVIDRLSHWYSDMLETGEEQEDLIEVIRAIPSAEPNTGYWIEHPEIETSTPEYLMFYECSECGNKQCFYTADTHRRNYCGNCGAKMVEEQEGSEE